MKTYPQRYERNFPAFSKEDFERLQKSTVCVAGCGGLGGYIIECLARTGIGTLIVFDGDTFDETNLNRQLFCEEHTIGMRKAEAAAKRIHSINSEIKIIAQTVFMDDTNCTKLIEGSTIVIDALDNIPGRLILQAHCKKLGIPLIHGAIGGFNAQITTILPGDDTLSRLYPKNKDTPSKSVGNLAFIASLAASIEVSEALKVLTGKDDLLRRQLLYIDLLTNEFLTFSI